MNLNNTEPLHIFLADTVAQLWSQKDQDPNPAPYHWLEVLLWQSLSL